MRFRSISICIARCRIGPFVLSKLTWQFSSFFVQNFVQTRSTLGTLRNDEIDYLYYKFDRIEHILALSSQVVDIERSVSQCMRCYVANSKRP